MILTEKDLIKQEAAIWAGRLPTPVSPSVLRRAVQALIIALTAVTVCFQLASLFPWPHWPHKVSLAPCDCSGRREREAPGADERARAKAPGWGRLFCPRVAQSKAALNRVSTLR